MASDASWERGRPRPHLRQHRFWHPRGYLPHFDLGATVQVVTFRLADSLPRDYFARAKFADDVHRRRHLEAMMDGGHGECILKVPACAEIVQRAFEYFDGQRYRLIAWVIMPNHVHVMIEQIEGHPLGDVVGTWKSYSARKINEQLNTKGIVWAPDYFDRFIRDGAHFANAVRYIEDNPVEAGLATERSKWPYSSATCR